MKLYEGFFHLGKDKAHQSSPKAREMEKTGTKNEIKL